VNLKDKTGPETGDRGNASAATVALAVVVYTEKSWRKYGSSILLLYFHKININPIVKPNYDIKFLLRSASMAAELHENAYKLVWLSDSC